MERITMGNFRDFLSTQIKSYKNKRFYSKLLRKKDLPSPKMITFEVTQRCNLNCGMCFYRNSGTDIGLTELSVREISDILNKNPNIKRCNLFGSEPFVRRDIIQIIDALTKRDISIFIATNGSLIREKTIKKLNPYKDNILGMGISIDGPKKVHDSIRGMNGIFNKTINGIKLCRNANIPVETNCVIQDDNINELDFVVEICKDIDVNSLTFQHFMAYTRDDVKKSYKLTGVKEDEIHVLTRDSHVYSFPEEVLTEKLNNALHRAEAIGLNVRIRPGVASKYPTCFYKGKIRENPTRLICDAFGLPRITPNGNVIFCPYIRSSFGNLTEISLEEIWNTHEFKNFRESLIKQKLLPICKRCCKLRIVS